MRHNEIRDSFATLMSEVCFDIEIEPKPQSFQGENFVNISTTTDEDARLDVKANGLWGSRFSRTFFDVKVFNPHAKTSRRLLKDAYKYHESLENSTTNSEFYKSNRAASARSFLAALVVPHQQLLGQCSG